MTACDACQYKRTAGRFQLEVCGCQCGDYYANCAHPLSPCKKDMCVYFDEYGSIVDPDDCHGDPIPECEYDEYAIIDGNRCGQYIGWLRLMHREVERAKGATE